VHASELIDHAVLCGMQDLAIEKGGELLSFLRNYLAYKEALITGLRIVKSISRKRRDEHYSRFYFEFGWILEIMSFLKEAVEYYEKAHQIFHEILGPDHPYTVSTKKALHYLRDSLSSHQE
jgi:tetratricopeptide (TPR) repeat protein